MSTCTDNRSKMSNAQDTNSTQNNTVTTQQPSSNWLSALNGKTLPVWHNSQFVMKLNSKTFRDNVMLDRISKPDSLFLSHSLLTSMQCYKHQIHVLSKTSFLFHNFLDLEFLTTTGLLKACKEIMLQ